MVRFATKAPAMTKLNLISLISGKMKPRKEVRKNTKESLLKVVSTKKFRKSTLISARKMTKNHTSKSEDKHKPSM